MAGSILHQLGSAFRTLNPGEVRAMVERRVVFGILAANEDCVDEIHDFLRAQGAESALGRILRIASEADFAQATVGFSEHGVPHPAHFYSFDRRDPSRSAASLLDEHESEWLPLARSFPGLRGAVSERLIWKIAKENTLFTVATGLPNLVPSILTLPWAAGEFASDTAFLTMNQVRLSFLLGAAHGHEIGYNQQCVKIGSIVGAAFGWKALARELVSKAPAGGGLVSKGLIAFAGTYAVGRGLEHWFREGNLLGRAEHRQFYVDAYHLGKDTVERIVKSAVLSSRTAKEAA